MKPVLPTICRWAFVFAVSGTLLQSPLTAQQRADRNNLLQYRGQDGTFQPVTSPEQWQQRRGEIVTGMQQVMGRFPDAARRVRLDVDVVEEEDAGTYVRRLITYQSEPDCRTPAYLCIPKDVLQKKRKASAVLCLHPTDNTVGHKVVVGLGGRQNRQYAAELAERGYVTISPSYPHLANYWPNLGGLGYQSGTMKAIWDNSRAIDLLAEMPETDLSRGVGAIRLVGAARGEDAAAGEGERKADGQERRSRQTQAGRGGGLLRC